MNKKGFTLMELLIVVLIIGVLTSIAVPMYKKSVEKSKAAEALSVMQSVAKSEHDFYLTKSRYTKDFEDLDITLTDKDGNNADNETLESPYYTYELLDKGIIANRNNGEYFLYKDYEMDQIMCTPSEHYICDNLGKLTKEPCDKMGMAWANTNSTCYIDEESRCKGLYGDSMWNGDFCGYNDAYVPPTDLNEGIECLGTSYYRCHNSVINGGVCNGYASSACQGSTATAGGICNSYADGACGGSYIYSGGICQGDGYRACWYANIYSGGICKGTCLTTTIHNGGLCEGSCIGANINEGGICNGTIDGQDSWGGGCRSSIVNSGGVCKGTGFNACASSTIKEGGECWANAEQACGSSRYGATTYEGTGATSGCCRGTYCPSDAPRCECTNHEKMDSNGNCITA